MKKIMLLGSGELGKEFVIAAQRLGQTVVACDSYAGAPAMQVADACEVFHMLDGDALAAAVGKHRPDIIVPEIEAIRTERLYEFEKAGVQVVPSARAVNFTMNRKAIRDLAAKELGLKTARYFYATSYDELKQAAAKIGYPCVVKPLMSSSGKGQSLVKGPEELEHAWRYGCEGSRGDIRELIIEEFIRFDSEITLLTVTQKDGPTLFCPPIGHVQKGGDYRESFQSPVIAPEHLAEAQRMAAAVTEAHFKISLDASQNRSVTQRNIAADQLSESIVRQPTRMFGIIADEFEYQAFSHNRTCGKQKARGKCCLLQTGTPIPTR